MGESSDDLFSNEVLWNLLDCGLIAVDSQCIVRNMNASAERLFGKSGRHVLGETLEKLLPGHPVALDLITRAYNLKMPCRLRNSQLFPAPGVSLSVSLTAVPLLNVNGEPEGALLQLEEVGEAERLEGDQRLSDTLDSLGNMAMAVAHEVKNPLAGIRGAAQLLEMEVTEKSAVACTDLIRTEVDRISRLLDKLLGLADDQLLQEQEVNIHEILNHVIQVCEHGEPVPIRDFDPSLPTIRGDRDQLIQLFLNLTQNAIEAAGPHGEVLLSSRISDRIRFEHGRRRHFIMVEVRDTGQGISQALLKRIFLPFVTSKHKGTGLGLAISQKIVNEHGGLIEVESEPGRTIFRVFLHVYGS
ncbi:MAG: PAS domain-containing protein [Magnetococcales bacterium]|nr:PAS domain-containing protein [Magnetococcales bacterium]